MESTPESNNAIATPAKSLQLSVKKLSAKSLKLERIIALYVVMIPFLGFILAMIFFLGKGITYLDLGLFFFMYAITGFGITVGYHRLFTHSSFQCPTWVRAFFAIAGSMALQGPVVRWVADHRRHHSFSDQAGDPHSPRIQESGASYSSMWQGFFQAHCGWFFSSNKTRLRRFVPDLFKDPVICWIDRYYLLWVLISLFLPSILALIITRNLYSAVTAFVWAGLVRIFFVHHVTWSINSVCHLFGSRPFDSGDSSVNCWWTSIFSLGESWHNAHHAFPRSAIHGLQKFEIDLSGIFIRFLEFLGLAHHVLVPTAEQIEQKRMSTQKIITSEA